MDEIASLLLGSQSDQISVSESGPLAHLLDVAHLTTTQPLITTSKPSTHDRSL